MNPIVEDILPVWYNFGHGRGAGGIYHDIGRSFERSIKNQNRAVIAILFISSSQVIGILGIPCQVIASSSSFGSKF